MSEAVYEGTGTVAGDQFTLREQPILVRVNAADVEAFRGLVPVMKAAKLPWIQFPATVSLRWRFPSDPLPVLWRFLSQCPVRFLLDEKGELRFELGPNQYFAGVMMARVYWEHGA